MDELGPPNHRAHHRQFGREANKEEIIIERLMDHEENGKDWRLRVRWYGYNPKEDTWQPIEGLPRSAIIRYFPRI